MTYLATLDFIAIIEFFYENKIGLLLVSFFFSFGKLRKCFKNGDKVVHMLSVFLFIEITLFNG